MYSLKTVSVMDQLEDELGPRRRTKTARRAAYLALAQVILMSDEQQERLVPAGFPRRFPRADWESAAAA